MFQPECNVAEDDVDKEQHPDAKTGAPDQGLPPAGAPSESSSLALEGPASNDDAELAAHHLEQLKASGLTEETINALGFATVDNEKARAALGWSEEMKGDPAGLLIPYPNVPGYAKVRPDKPRVINAGEKKVRSFTDHDYSEKEVPAPPKVIKYEAPLGAGTHCYIPKPNLPKMLDPEERLYITEGEKKAALMVQEGEPCIGLPGVSMSHDVEHRREAQDWGGQEFILHPELKPYILPGREVCIVFDSPDMEENLQVIRCATKLARMLVAADAKALIGYLPTLKGRSKTGIDDYFVEKRRHAGSGPQPKSSLLSWDFARGRPVGPNAALAWLAEEKREHGWGKDELHVELKRTAIWARVWHEGEQKAFNDWCRAAAKEFYVKVEDLKAMAAHLPISQGKKTKTGYDAFEEADLVEHCVPVLNEGFALFRNADGTERVFAVNERREVTLVLKDAPLVQALHDALKEKFGVIPPERLLDKAIALWKRECRRLDVEPEPFCFRGDALTFKRFDWEPGPGEHPAWDEFLSRLSDRDAFMAFVWSCFEARNRSRQYLWLRGNGQDGKSRALSTLAEVFGPAATGITGSQLKDSRFLYSAIYGKRVVVYADCKNSKFGMSEFVRNATSGDPVMVEFKSATAFSWQMRIKLLVASNPKPEITGQTADASRMLYIEVSESKNKDDPTWGARLGTELPAFLHACREVYERVCPRHGDIKLSERSRDLQAEAIAAFEERWHELFNAHFEVKVGTKTVADKVSKRLRGIGLSNNEVGDFKQWMERVHGVRAKRLSSVRYYENLVVIDAAQEALGQFRR